MIADERCRCIVLGVEPGTIDIVCMGDVGVGDLGVFVLVLAAIAAADAAESEMRECVRSSVMYE